MALARDGFSVIEQADFSAGEFRGVALDAIPRNGCFSIRNGLLDEDGAVYRRGGSVYKSTAGLGSSGLTFLWVGYLGATLTAVLANAADFATMDMGTGALTNQGGAGLSVPVRAVALGDELTIGGGVTWDGAALGAAAETAPVYAVAGRRLIALSGSIAKLSNIDTPGTFTAGEEHELPPDSRTIAAAGLGNRLIWGTTGGVWVVNDLELDVVDELGNAPQRVDHPYPEMVAWGQAGIGYWQGGVILPALDGCWLIDGVSAPVELSRSIRDLWREYVTAGYTPGLAAVHRNHFFLPILQGSAFVKTLVCRLDRPVDTRFGRVFPWTHFEEQGGAITAFASGPDGVLYGAEAGATSRVVRLPYFDPSSAVKADASGSAPSFYVTMADRITGSGQPNTVVGVEVGYEMADAATDDPQMIASYSTGRRSAAGTTWGSFVWGEEPWSSGGDDTMDPYGTDDYDTAPEDSTGETPFTFREAVRCRRFRLRIEATRPSARLALRYVRLLIRPSGRQ